MEKETVSVCTANSTEEILIMGNKVARKSPSLESLENVDDDVNNSNSEELSKEENKSHLNSDDDGIDDTDSDYKYISIVDVNPPSEYINNNNNNNNNNDHSKSDNSAAVSCASPVSVDDNNSLDESTRNTTDSSELLKCSVVIGGENSECGEINNSVIVTDGSVVNAPIVITVDGNNKLTDNNNKSENSGNKEITQNGNYNGYNEDDDDDNVDEGDGVNGEVSSKQGDNSVNNIGTNQMEEDVGEEKGDLREKFKRSRSGSSDYWIQEEQDDDCIVDYLDKSNDHAEARLAAKRQARAEAREIRMRELERQQREAEETSDKVYDMYSTPETVNRSVRSVASPRSSSLLSGANSYHSSRRSSEDSLEDGGSLRDVRHELKELEEKFRKAMIANAQLDNEKAAVAYQVELYKDRFEELEEQHSQLQREHKEKCRQLDQLKRVTTKLEEDLEWTRAQLEERDRLIQEQGLVIVGGECSSSEEDSSEGNDKEKVKKMPKRALVSAQVAGLLETGEGSLDVRLKKFLEERNELMDELRHVKLELEEERSRSRGHRVNSLNGPHSDDIEDIQREANKLLGDYKFKLQKAEQDVSTLQANVARLESQVVRYKSAAETAEKVEDELKLEKRKLQRELREAQARIEELETAHSHLQRRLDKLKNAKSALLKDL